MGSKPINGSRPDGVRFRMVRGKVIPWTISFNRTTKELTRKVKEFIDGNI